MTPSTNSMSRREFLGCAAGCAIAGPALAGLGGKSGLEPIILGAGEHRYECIHDWGELPGSIAYGNTHGVCEDSQGRIYIKHTVGAGSSSGDAIVVFDERGKFVRSFGSEFRGGAHGLHLQKKGGEEFLYLCDPARGLMVKTTLDGKDVYRLGCPMESGLYGSAAEYHPTNVAVAPDGTLFVADGYGLSWIHIHDAKGSYRGSFGGPGDARGQVRCPHGLMVDTRGPEPLLVVADRANRRMQYFSLDGRSRGFVTDEMRSPCHFHERGGVLVVPDLEARVTLLDRDNRLIAHLGDGENYGLRDRPRGEFIPGRFIAPHSAIFDHAGNIFVVEWVEVGRVTKLRKV